MTDGRGLSVGAANLVAVAVGRQAVRRTAVLTTFGHRPPEVGVPGENPGLDERGLVITDFVDRVGDPVALLASDGSPHRAEVLLADALRAMLSTVERGPSTDPVGVAHPAHWRPAAVQALRGALASTPGFRPPRSVLLVSDATAALTALRQEPGIPTRGVIALCDFGGTGTSITVADAAGLAPVGPTVRHLDFSGDAVDQALLRHVMTGLGGTGSTDLTGTSAIGSLARLRAQCRAAKERLSNASVTSLPGERGEIRVTRRELDDAIREPLAGTIAELQDMLQRNGIRAGGLAAIAITGGGARIPLVTTALSEHFRVPIIAATHPELAAAIGAGLSAVRGTVVEGATALAPAAGVVAAASAPTGLAPAAGPAASGLAWSVDDDAIPDVTPGPDYEPTYQPDLAAEADAFGGDDARPRLEFAESEPSTESPPPPWYRNPFVLVIGGIAVALAAIGVAIVVTLDAEDGTGGTTETTATPTTTTGLPPTSAAPGAPAETAAPEPAPRSAPRRTNVAPSQPPPVTVTEQAPPPTTQPAPTTEAPSQTTDAPPPVTTTAAPPPSSTTQQPVIPTLPYQTIPGLPFVPSPFQPQQPG